jgi:hypothetical protein
VVSVFMLFIFLCLGCPSVPNVSSRGWEAGDCPRDSRFE